MAGSENDQTKKSFWTDAIHDRERVCVFGSGREPATPMMDPGASLCDWSSLAVRAVPVLQ